MTSAESTLVTVPRAGLIIPADATAEGIVEEVKVGFIEWGIPLTYFEDDLLELVRRDLDEVRGKTLKGHIRNFGRDWETEKGRDWQKSMGADGNAAAHLLWIKETKLMGWSVSIANDDARLFCSPGGCLCAPYFLRTDRDREFGLNDVEGRWRGGGLLVAFSVV